MNFALGVFFAFWLLPQPVRFVAKHELTSFFFHMSVSSCDLSISLLGAVASDAPATALRGVMMAMMTYLKEEEGEGENGKLLLLLLSGKELIACFFFFFFSHKWNRARRSGYQSSK